MKKALILLLLLVLSPRALAQVTPTSDEDLELRLALKKKCRSEAVNYSHKEFDALFLEFFQKTGPTNPTVLTKEEYYGYTVRIAWYSERMGMLYPKEKEAAKKSSAEWFNKRYSDYVASKNQKP
ncbi:MULTISPECIES: hypothetical protein [unclassified Flavobacterium]|uniref:hypothetical protein n=1 Tax=unclassified Flavobacterium TaxID=196869 RepID=UPI001F138849|nr:MULTISPECIES: hypothetical protein [unclassified Flavobacterium]UMY66670.1 hypothetical protein MKO97_04595 [Flavobacterium sp. HJ-32-4]